MFNKKIASELAVGVILLLALTISGIFWWKNKQEITQNNPEQKACTMEAKICPDGSNVGRIGPNCEFAPCPRSSDQGTVNSDQQQLANPASVYCVQNGGKSEIKTAEDGSQTGYCKFDDGSECEEWAYYRKECVNGNSNSVLNVSDWKVYRNARYDIEFKYPKDWNRAGDEKNEPDWLGLSGNIYKKSTTQTYPDPKFPLDALVSISQIDNPRNHSLQELFDNNYKKCLEQEKKLNDSGMGCPGAFDTTRWQQIVIDGNTALRSGRTGIPEGPEGDLTYIKLSGKFLIISATYYNDEYTELDSIINGLISTIKFTN